LNKNGQSFERSDDIKVTVENSSIKILKTQQHHCTSQVTKKKPD